MAAYLMRFRHVAVPRTMRPTFFFSPNSAHETERLQSSDTIELKSMVSRLAVVTPVNRQDNEALVPRVPRASQEHHRSITGAHKSITSAVVTPVNRQDNEPTRLRDSCRVAVTTLSVSQLSLG